jgi:surface carbohydrate biosynthesis protein
MTKKKTIYFPIEHANRELKSKVYLAALLADKRYRCYIGSSAEIIRVMLTQKISLLFHKSTCVNIIKSLKEKNQEIVFMDEELGVAAPHTGREDNVEWRYETCERDDYEMAFAISEIYSGLISEKTDGRLRSCATGWPRFDLIHPRAVDKFNISDQNKVMLLSTFGRLTKKSFEDVLTQGTADAHFTNKYRWELFNQYRNSLPLIARILQDHGLHLVVRPHPSEPLTEWNAIISNIKNVSIDETTDLADALADVRFVINPGSTAGVQAALLGIPSVSLPHAKVNGLTDTVVFSMTEMASDEADLVAKGMKLATMDMDQIRNMAISLLAS